MALYRPEFSGRIFFIEAPTDKITSTAPSVGTCTISEPSLRKVSNGRQGVGLLPVFDIPEPSYFNLYLVERVCWPNDSSAVLSLFAMMVTSPFVYSLRTVSPIACFFLTVSSPISMSENCASDHSTMFATVQDILQVALAGGGTAVTEAGTQDRTQAVNTIMNALPLLIIPLLYQNQAEKVKSIRLGAKTDIIPIQLNFCALAQQSLERKRQIL